MNGEQVLNQKDGDSGSQVRIGVSPPFPCKPPHFVGLLLDMLLDPHNRLPPGISLAVGCDLSREDSLCLSDSLKDGHAFSQR